MGTVKESYELALDRFFEQMHKSTSYTIDPEYVYNNIYPYKNITNYSIIIDTLNTVELRKFNTYLWVMREFHDLWNL